MFVIIVGGGKTGYHLTKILMKEDCDVTVIDKKSDVCKEIEAELECECIHGDATKPYVIQKAGIHEADAIIALTGNDETNLIISLIAKQLGAKQIIAKLSSLHYSEEMLKKIGLDIVIYPEAAAAGYISELITKPELFDVAFVAHGRAEIMHIKVGEKSKIAGKTIKNMSMPEGATIIAMIENEKIKIPNAKTKIKVGDELLIFTKIDKAKQIRRFL